MSFRSLELPGLMITSLSSDADSLVLEFDGRLIKTMEGAAQRTRWKQSGSIHLKNPRVKSNPNPQLPCRLAGGDAIDNVYVHSDIIRVPLHGFGEVGLELRFENADLALLAFGSELEVKLHGDARYLGHID